MISDELEKTLHRAQNLAHSLNHQYMTLEHLLCSIIDDVDAKKVFSACEVDLSKLKNDVQAFVKNNLKDLFSNNKNDARPTLGFQRVIQRAVIHVQSSGKEEANGANVLVAIFSERESHAVYFLQQQNLNRLDVVNYISHGVAKNSLESEISNIDDNQQEKKSENSENFLDQFCTNLNQKAKDSSIDPIIGRENEISRIIHVLSRRKKNNPIFVGDPGVGKTALAEGLAHKIVKEEVPNCLQDSIIFSLDLGGVLAGTRFRGDFEERLKKLINIFEKKDDYILFIDEIHTLIGAGGTNSGSIDASNILKPALSRGNLKCIGSTTYSEYRNYFEKDRALCRRFQKIDVEEPSDEDSIKILDGIKKYYEDFHDVQYDSDCSTEAVKLSKKFLINSKLPDKAIDILDETAASVKINEKRKSKIINKDDISITLSKIANIPANTIKSNEKIRIKTLDRDLKTLIFGQDNAVKKVSSAIKMAKAGLKNEEKPIGSFLFTGPTGVGKTELARQLANIMKINFVRFDMSEYMEKHSVSKLIGAPPGYVGFDQGGLLTDSVDKQPYSLVLLDEIEKAHPDLFNILLQIMDYGKLTDHLGKTVDFSNVILIMTSNIGASDLVRDKIGFFNDKMSEVDNDKAVKNFFSPEFRNRLDNVIHFKMLNQDNCMKIVDKFLIELESLIIDKDLVLSVSDLAKKKLLEWGFDHENGARPMSRIIQENIKIPLAELILKNKLKKGEVKVDFDIKTKKIKVVLVPLSEKKQTVSH
ncbi:MAG: ATP-dependent Clp protease ATP-binding subunit ClpA [Alphaproteobacteria bacterium MarineAlpha8_Bin1]|nr:MAG: ATP-dependent Clp protease ATP-binding subunit ClpA [Alphaproteobacteria bacterium MarineAlpha8_Bin1]